MADYVLEWHKTYTVLKIQKKRFSGVAVILLEFSHIFTLIQNMKIPTK